MSSTDVVPTDCGTSTAEGLRTEEISTSCDEGAMEGVYRKEGVVVPSEDVDSVGEYGCRRSSSMVASPMYIEVDSLSENDVIESQSLSRETSVSLVTNTGKVPLPFALWKELVNDSFPG